MSPGSTTSGPFGFTTPPGTVNGGAALPFEEVVVGVELGVELDVELPHAAAITVSESAPATSIDLVRMAVSPLENI
jgi:hypothetical protein